MRCLLLELRVCEYGWQVSSWVRAALEEENYADEAPEIAGILKSQKVKGTALLELTAEKMRTVGILMGPAEVLAKRIAAVSAPPMAASGFQVGASARVEGCLGVTGEVAVQLFVRTTRKPRSSSGSWPRLRQSPWVKAAWGLGVDDFFCLRHCCRRAGLQPHEVPARKALRPERAQIIDAQHDAPSLAGHLRAHEGRHRARGHVGRPRHREEPQFGAGPLAPGDGPAAGRASAARGHRV